MQEWPLTDDTDDALDIEQWANSIGDDDELDRLWAALLEATAPIEAKDMPSRIAAHLATLGARARRTTEGLILAAPAATAAEGPAWDDWRVVLHRHFARDERMDVAVAAAILMELRKTAAQPDWRSAPDQVMQRVVRSFVRDMLIVVEAIDKPEEPVAASASLVMLASDLFDVSIALQPDQLEELQNSAEVAAMLADLLRRLGDGGQGHARLVATNLVRARALVEVTIRQLEIGVPVVH
jgi:hypothetical protein